MYRIKKKKFWPLMLLFLFAKIIVAENNNISKAVWEEEKKEFLSNLENLNEILTKISSPHSLSPKITLNDEIKRVFVEIEKLNLNAYPQNECSLYDYLSKVNIYLSKRFEEIRCEGLEKSSFSHEELLSLRWYTKRYLESIESYLIASMLQDTHRLLNNADEHLEESGELLYSLSFFDIEIFRLTKFPLLEEKFQKMYKDYKEKNTPFENLLQLLNTNVFNPERIGFESKLEEYTFSYLARPFLALTEMPRILLRKTSKEHNILSENILNEITS